MKYLIKLYQSKLLLLAIVLLGIGLRFLAATRGNNYDFDSFLIVANIVSKGLNVYASTNRYNYGPIWFQLINIMFLVSSKNIIVFRYILVASLSLVDLAIFAILYKKLGKSIAYLFFLNPISIIITGYHNQFDNLALLLGMMSVLTIGENFGTQINRQKLLGLLILGISLSTKHLLIVFPIWLAVKQKGIFQKIFIIIVPLIIFFCSFIPYWKNGYQGIINNVFLYKSFFNEYFYRIFVPSGIQAILSSTEIWIILLITFAMIFRKRNGFDSLLLYTCILVAASPSIANQYLSIVVPFVAANLNPFTLSYTLIGTFYLLKSADGLHFYGIQNVTDTINYQIIFYPILVILLCLGFIRRIWYKQLHTLLNNIYNEIKIQLGYKE